MLDWLRPARWTARETVIVLAPGVICLALAGLILAEVDAAPAMPEDPRPARSSPVGTNAGPAEQDFTLPPIEALAEVTNRPLFSRTRRPPEQAEEALGQVEEFVLAGIVVSASDRIALIRHGQPIKIARLKEGQSIEGWTVRSIAADRVLIENAGSEHELRLSKKSARGDLVRTPG